MIRYVLACAGTGRVPATTDTPPAVPLLGEALACDPTPEPLPDGDDLRRATLAAPDALCNDGTPGVLYLRAATEPEHDRDFVLYLDGGRYCEDWEVCVERWCGRGFYDAHKMSTAWAPETRPVEGLTGPHADNPFRGWNQVFFHYCSSDRWSGTRRDVVLDGDPPFRLHFLGDALLGAGLDALREGLASDDGVEALSSLATARRVLVAGSSAGGQGVFTQLDRIAGGLPGVDVRGVVDAVFYPDRELLEPDTAALFAADLQLVDADLYGLWGGVADRSCAEAGLGWECRDGNVVLREHTATPVFLHHDLADAEIYDGSFAFAMTEQAYVDAALATFARWEADGTGSFLLTGCGEHTALSSDVRFLEYAVAGTSVALAIAAHAAGDTVTVADDATLSQSVCGLAQ